MSLNVQELSVSNVEALIISLKQQAADLEKYLENINKKNLLLEHLRDPTTFDFNYHSLIKFDDDVNTSDTLSCNKSKYYLRHIASLFNDRERDNLNDSPFYNPSYIPTSLRVPGYIPYIEVCIKGKVCFWKRSYRRTTPGEVDTYKNYVDSTPEEDKIIEKIVSLTKILDEMTKEDFGDEDLFNEFFYWFIREVNRSDFKVITNKKENTFTTNYLSKIGVNNISGDDNVREVLRPVLSEINISKLLYSFSAGDRSERLLSLTKDYSHFYLGDRIKTFSLIQESLYVTHN